MAVTRQSSWRSDPAAALRGLAKGSCSGLRPASRASAARRSITRFMASKCSFCSSTSPRTSTRGGTRPASRGSTPAFAPRRPTVRRLAVTSSPTAPSPRVEPSTSSPSSYTSSTARPSSLGSQTYSISVPGAASSSLRTRASNSSSSSSVVTLPRLSMGSRWRTLANPAPASPETRRVGESSVASDGCASSRARSSRMSRSYSASERAGLSRT